MGRVDYRSSIFTEIYFKQNTLGAFDIAGMAFSKYAGALNSSGATGYGVRLLNKFVEDNYGKVEQTLSLIKPDAVEEI